jgi:hypothetical protein
LLGFGTYGPIHQHEHRIRRQCVFFAARGFLFHRAVVHLIHVEVALGTRADCREINRLLLALDLFNHIIFVGQLVVDNREHVVDARVVRISILWQVDTLEQGASTWIGAILQLPFIIVCEALLLLASTLLENVWGHFEGSGAYHRHIEELLTAGPVSWVCLQDAPDQEYQVLTILICDPWVLAPEDLTEQRLHILGQKWWSEHEHLVYYTAEGPNVTLVVIWLIPPNLR